MENEQKQVIQELATLLHDNNLSEIEYKTNDLYIHVVGPKNESNVMVQPTQMVSAPMVQPVVAGTPSVEAKENKVENYIVSPMVGVAYLSKDPHSPTFVKVGDKVSMGQTVCLVEAMKTFNPIKSTKAGTITEVLVEDGSPVEYNQPLFNVG